MSNMYGIESPKLTKTNPHFKNAYAPLDEVQRVIAPFLEENGATVLQTVSPVDGTLFFFSSLHDNEGKMVRQVAIPWDAGKGGPQGVGSALTYARRYGLLLLFNLVGEEDDDGNAGQNDPPKKKRAPAKKTAGAKRPAPKKPTGTKATGKKSGMKTVEKF